MDGPDRETLIYDLGVHIFKCLAMNSSVETMQISHVRDLADEAAELVVDLIGVPSVHKALQAGKE